MKKYLKILIALFCFILTEYQGVSQTDNLKTEMMNVEFSQQEMVSKSRILLKRTIEDNDISKTIEIVNFIENKLEDTNNLGLYFEEKISIYYITGLYDSILRIVETFDKEDSYFYVRLGLGYFYKKARPSFDSLNIMLQEKVLADFTTIIENIYNTNLTQENKEFLILYLQKQYRYLQKIEQDSLNNEATKFIESYPNSLYVGIVKNDIRYEYVRRDFGIGFEVFVGVGIYTDNLNDYFRDPFLLGGDIDLYYKRFMLYLRGTVGMDTKLKRDLSISNTIMKENTKVSFLEPEIGFGYMCLDKKRFNLAPIVGISRTIIKTIKPTQEDPNYKEIKISEQTYGLGLDFCLKPKWVNNYNDDYFLDPDAIGFLKFRYMIYFPQFERGYELKGVIHSITFGIGIGGRGLKRQL